MPSIDDLGRMVIKLGNVWKKKLHFKMFLITNYLYIEILELPSDILLDGQAAGTAYAYFGLV
jgi:hypothetical protein